MSEHQWLTDIIAGIPDLVSHRFIDYDGEYSVTAHDEREVAERVVDFLVREFGLREEMRTNAMSSSGMTTDTRTGVTTSHSDMRYDRRYVTDWKEVKS